MAINVTITDKKLTMVIDIDEHLSASGKNMIIASTSGNVQTGAEYKGKPVIVGFNAYYKPKE